MKANPPVPADAPVLARFTKIGLVPGQDFDTSKLKADFVKRIPQIAFDSIMLQFQANAAVKDINGWDYTTKTVPLRSRFPIEGAPKATLVRDQTY